ncbi:MAG: TauD/TfdA dioxygenase family protein, partial [Stellaceae bacterium]
MKVEKATARIGARVSGIDLTQPLDGATVADIRAALLDNLVLFFVEQKPLDEEQHIRLARYFGEIDIPEFRTTASTHDEVMV